ncbi:type VII secretion protein EccB [Buchananella hordeovulneris]|uniref:type VII secretion protein EccB n=1 Tax=Buchananella hordeovulneris TaxID=52770 RepID=UPI000F5F502F|nr:type VII secretion protein EccB [Buchananella hordeovulneris]RRD41918.1 type VII secretion protein EccB [Buchananella hordeovulneris]
MPSNKDILEAQRFNRRRLITAFSSGAPGGRELEPRSPLRPLFVGLLLALVLLAVAAVAGRFAPTLPANWQNSTVIVVKGTGARYYSINGILHPVTNITSAKLLSEPGNYQTSEVSASTIAGINRGPQVGITDVPDDVPAAAALQSSQWTTCALPDGPHTWVATTPTELEEASTMLVEVEGDVYLLHGSTAHPLPAESRNGVLLALGLETAPRTQVPAAWLSIFTTGSPLTALTLTNVGQPTTGMPPKLADASIGTIVEVAEENTSRFYVVSAPQTLAPLSPVAKAMYGLNKSDALTQTPLSVTVADIAQLQVDADGVAPADWPTSISLPTTPGLLPCLRLTTQEETLSAQLAALPVPKEDLGANPVTVGGGSGALVRLTTGGDLGAVSFISDIGKSHSLGADPTSTLAHLGWSPEDIVDIPAAWGKLVPAGGTMTSETVWQTVEKQ